MAKRDNEEDAVKREAIRLGQLDFSSIRTTHIANIIRCMEDAFERVKISLILPQLIQNREILVKVLTGTSHEKAVRLIDDFIRRRTIVLKEHRAPLMDHGMIKIIDYFQMHHSLYTLFPLMMNKMNEQERKLLTTFAKLIELAKLRLERTANAQIQKERYLQGVTAEKERLNIHIKDLEEKMEEYIIEENTRAANKVAYVIKIDEEMKVKRQMYEDKIAQETERYNRAVQANVKTSQEKQVELAEELEKIKYEYAKQIKDNKKMEKEGRDEKNKLQIQLQGIIRKYDTTIGEKRVENLELTDQLNEAKARLTEFMVEYRKEAAIYNEIVVKREKEEERIKQQAIMVYMMNRAACTIQRYWRAWRKHMSKKSRKNRKKK